MPTEDLTEFIEQVTGDSHLRVEDDLGDGYVVLKVSEAQRRQARHDIRCSEDVVIEMLRNARDAGARNIFVATSKAGDKRRITMLDDGSGIPENLVSRIFDARVTSKLDSAHVDTWGVHGRGMALFAVKMNTEQAYVSTTQRGGGSSIVVVSDTTKLPEKTDQSSLPRFTLTESGSVSVTGPRNINRTVCEFAYVGRDSLSVYLGGPVEIAATLWEFGCALVPESTRMFCDDPSSLPVCKRLAAASSPEQLCSISSQLGLEFSERSARRIMDGEVACLSPLSETVRIVNAVSGKAPQVGKRARKAARKDSRGLKVSEDDLAAFEERLREAFHPLARSYFLDANAPISLSVSKDGIKAFFPAEKDL